MIPRNEGKLNEIIVKRKMFGIFSQEKLEETGRQRPLT